MPLSDPSSGLLQFTAAPAPSTPLGPFEDSAVAWATWVTLMGFVGVTALALTAAGPAARRIGADTLAAVTARLSRTAVVLAVLAVAAVLTELAHSGDSGGYHYQDAWNTLHDGTNAGRLSGIEVTMLLVGAAVIAPLAFRAAANGRARTGPLAAGLGAGMIALGTTRFPDAMPEEWGHTIFETAMWMLHLFGGAVWLGGLAGLALLAVPGAVPPAERAAFWSPAIRRFSAAAMGCVTAITLSGLFLYWEHVDGPSQLFTTMYGRVLGVKILIFGTLLLLGVFNQFWLHPRIDALRAAGDERPLRTILVRQFPAVVTVETLLGMSLLFVAPFLHGSARNQAFQSETAKHSAKAISPEDLPRLPDKVVSASTWVLGSTETLVLIALMIGGYWYSGVLARRRTAAVPGQQPATGDLVEA
ncbi:MULTISPECIES: copper resistance D family protein [unclassified Streptomyces]|uniref:copper resistance D family protein n=1 Tax=unclassified Streptomyces TaxID=2593676 RepID=UPI002E35D25D|nr:MULTISPECIES: CopD family protein [unclassified Streptomyces]